MEVGDYQGKKVAILGFGDESQVTYKFLTQLGAKLQVFSEQSADDHPENTVVAGAREWELDEFDFVVRTPGLALHKLKTTAKITSATQIFLELCPAPVIGVTGTKGKGTTVTLIAKILEEAGEKVHPLGNIGNPALGELEKIDKDDLVVFEMSSFQLWNVDLSPHVAVVLMVEPEHLDVHKDLDDYLDAKSNITAHQTVNDVVIYHPYNEMSARVAENGQGKKLKYMSADGARIDFGELVVGTEKIMPVEEFGLVGPHNRENICAAVTAAWEFTQNKDAIRRAVTDFTGLEHRLEFVREVDGAKFYNDSFATTPGAAIAAMHSFDAPEIIILGGSDKQSDYSDLAEAIVNRPNVKQVLLIGEMADNINEALESFDYTSAIKVGGGINSIVKKAAEMSEADDVVLLSPACASFDMFENYKKRGELYMQAVSEL